MPLSGFKAAFTLPVTRSSRTSGNEDDDDGDASGDNATRPVAGPSKRRRTSSGVSSTGEDSSEVEGDGRPLSGPPSGVPSTVEGEFSDDEDPDVGGDFSDDEDPDVGGDAGDDQDIDSDEAARIDADLVASVGNVAADRGDE